MQLFLEVIEGASMIGRSVWLRPGDICRFGSDPDNELPLLDLSIRAKAGTLLASGMGASLISPAGVTIRDLIAGPVETLKDGDTFACGPFKVLLRGYSSAPSVIASPMGALISWMSRVRGSLYAIFDAARDPLVLELLKEAACHQLSLFDGDTRVRMADAAPYLVQIPQNSPALELLVRASWGKGWASFLASELDFMAVRAQLRRSLMAQLPTGEIGYLRFFDPSILQTFLPASNAKEVREFSAGITEFIVEQNEGPDQALRFYLPENPREQRRIEIHLLAEIGVGSSPVYERPA